MAFNRLITQIKNSIVWIDKREKSSLPLENISYLVESKMVQLRQVRCKLKKMSTV